MAELANSRLFETAYLLGHGRGIGWSGNRDLGVGLLYEKSATVDDRAKPLPPRGSSMTWMPNRRIESIRACVEDGTLLIRWNDETARLFSTWDHATNGSVDKFVDASYLASARITPEHDGVEWPDGERISAKTLYERSPIIDAEHAI